MEKLIYNIQIFMTWFKYVLLKRPINQEALALMLDEYEATPRERKLLLRIKLIQIKGRKKLDPIS